MSWDTDGPIPHRPAVPPNVCADTFPGHDDAAVVVRGWAYFGEQARVVAVAIPPTSQLAAKILDAPAGAYSIATDERLPRL